VSARRSWGEAEQRRRNRALIDRLTRQHRQDRAAWLLLSWAAWAALVASCVYGLVAQCV